MARDCLLVGPTHSGKDSIASVLIAWFGYERLSFADSLKRDVETMLRSVGVRPDFSRYKELYRPLLQWYGVFRRTYNPDHWAAPVVESASRYARLRIPVVITDARFRNEILPLRQQGFLCIHLDMPEAGVRHLLSKDGILDADAVLSHVSETEWKEVLRDYPSDVTIPSHPGQLADAAFKVLDALGLHAGFTPAEQRAEYVELRKFFKEK